MNQFFLQAGLAALLVFGAQQDATQAPPAAPSLADAARAARERQKSANSKHVLTNDEVSTGGGSSAAVPGQVSEAQARAVLENLVPALPTAQSFENLIKTLNFYAQEPPSKLAAGLKAAALSGYEKVNFPGRKEWEQEMDGAANNLHDESTRALPHLQAFLDTNREALSSSASARRDVARLQELRTQGIDIMAPCATWLARLQQLLQEGGTQSKAHLDNNASARNEYRHSRVPAAEFAAAWGLVRFNEAEAEYKKKFGYFACSISDFGMDYAKPQGPHNSGVSLHSEFNGMRNYDYRFTLQNCGSQFFQALAEPPVSDGSQGRAFCTDQSLVVRYAEDGRWGNCLTNGKTWQGQ
jgi:hypothetical protein